MRAFTVVVEGNAQFLGATLEDLHPSDDEEPADCLNQMVARSFGADTPRVTLSSWAVVSTTSWVFTWLNFLEAVLKAQLVNPAFEIGAVNFRIGNNTTDVS